MYILFGGGPLLLEFVKRLKKKGLPVFVVTSERHANESVASGENVMSFRDALEKEKIDYIVTVDINTERVIKKGITSETLGMSFGAAWIFRKSFISRFNGRLINAHGTRLPMDRGGGGFSWRIMRGDRKGCSLLHLVDAGIDTGNIVRRKEYTFPASCRVPKDYFVYSISRDLAFLDKFVEDVQAGRAFKVIRQDESKSIYWPRLATKIHGYIDWNWARRDVEGFICAFDDPYDGAITGKKMCTCPRWSISPIPEWACLPRGERKDFRRHERGWIGSRKCY